MQSRSFFYSRFCTGMKTYLISGRRLEHDLQCGCSQVKRSGGDSISMVPCSQPRTLDLISGGAQVAQPQQPPDKMVVGIRKASVKHITYECHICRFLKVLYYAKFTLSKFSGGNMRLLPNIYFIESSKNEKSPSFTSFAC